MTNQTRFHIIHVGSVTSKGTYALLKAELSELKRICPSSEISVSTTDCYSLRRLEPNLKASPPLIDIPYEIADSKAIQNKKSRRSWNYKFYLVTYTLLVPIQAVLSLFSCLLLNANLPSFYRSEKFRQLRESDLIISTADENFKEGSLHFQYNVTWKLLWWFMLFSRAWDIIVAKKAFRKSVVVFPNSLGPFKTRFGSFMTRTALNNVDLILLRELRSNSFLRILGVFTPIVNTTDIALLLDGKKKDRSKGLVAQKKTIGVSPGLYSASLSPKKQMDYIAVHSQLLDWMIEEYGVEVVFLPLEITTFGGDDYSFCEMILKRMRHQDQAKIVCEETPEGFKEYLADLDMLISSRMHPLVLASSEMLPSVVICYDHKQTGFLDQLGLSCCGIDINDVSFEKMQLKTEYVWKNKENIRKHLETIVPILQNDLRMKIQKICQDFLPIQ